MQNLGIGSATALNLCSGQPRLKIDTSRHTCVNSVTAEVYAKEEDRTLMGRGLCWIILMEGGCLLDDASYC